MYSLTYLLTCPKKSSGMYIYIYIRYVYLFRHVTYIPCYSHAILPWFLPYGPLGPSRHPGAHGTRRFHGHRDAWQLIQPFEEQIAPSDENRLGRWCAMPAQLWS